MTILNTDESQNIEFKESWNDKYLQWICGFANAQGGRIYIGVNDNHEDIGYIVVLPSQYALQSRHCQHILPCRRSGSMG